MYLRFFKHLLSSAVTSTRYHKILLMSSKHWHFLSREIFNKLYKLRMRSDGMTGICRTLRFLLGSSIFYPTFAKTRLRLKQFPRCRALARTSLRKPRYRHSTPDIPSDRCFLKIVLFREARPESLSGYFDGLFYTDAMNIRSRSKGLQSWHR